MPQRARESRLAHEALVRRATARARCEVQRERDRAPGGLVVSEEHATGRARPEQLLQPVAPGDDLASARGLALRALIAPVAQIDIEVRRHALVRCAKLEQRVARAIAQ